MATIAEARLGPPLQTWKRKRRPGEGRRGIHASTNDLATMPSPNCLGAGLRGYLFAS